MRGRNESQVTMLSLVTPDQRVPKDHPLRRVKALTDEALAALSPTFDAMYSNVGRPSIPPERLLKATLLMAFYSVRSERLFCEQLDYNLLFRWFLAELPRERADGEPERAPRRPARRAGHGLRRAGWRARDARRARAGLRGNHARR